MSPGFLFLVIPVPLSHSINVIKYSHLFKRVFYIEKEPMNKLRRFGTIALYATVLLFAVIAFSYMLASILASFMAIPGFSEAMVALGTLVLAAAAFVAIINSNKQEKRRYESNLLKDILEWAEQIAAVGKDSPSPDLEQYDIVEKNPETNKVYLWNIMTSVMHDFERLEVKSVYRRKMATFFGEHLTKKLIK